MNVLPCVCSCELSGLSSRLWKTWRSVALYIVYTAYTVCAAPEATLALAPCQTSVTLTRTLSKRRHLWMSVTKPISWYLLPRIPIWCHRRPQQGQLHRVLIAFPIVLRHTCSCSRKKYLLIYLSVLLTYRICHHKLIMPRSQTCPNWYTRPAYNIELYLTWLYALNYFCTFGFAKCGIPKLRFVVVML